MQNMTKKEYIEALKTVEKEKENRLMELAKKNANWTYMGMTPIAILVLSVFAPLLTPSFIPKEAQGAFWFVICFLISNSFTIYFFIKATKGVKKTIGNYITLLFVLALNNCFWLPITLFCITLVLG